jgi:hypothetical protein
LPPFYLPPLSASAPLHPSREAGILELTSLIQTQHASGYFKPTQAQMDKLGTYFDTDDLVHDLVSLLSGCNTLRNSDSSEMRGQLISTVVIVVFIQRQHADDKELWELVIHKAERWAAQALGDHADLVTAVWNAAKKSWKEKRSASDEDLGITVR